MKIPHIKKIVFCLLIMSSLFTFAQDPEDPFADPGVVAPINDYIIPFGVLVIIFALLIIKKIKLNKIN